MTKKVKQFFLFSLFFSAITLGFFSFTPVNAFEFTCQPFWFFIDEPTTISFEEMYFRVFNKHQTEELTITCDYEPLEGIDLRVHFEVPTCILPPGSARKIHYSIQANLTYAVTYTLKINIKQKVINTEGVHTVLGGSIVNKVTFFTEDEGAMLLLHAVNQIGTPRQALMKLHYRVNSSFIWTPIKTVNDTSLTGVFPLGYYLVQVMDLATRIYVVQEFYLGNNTIVDVFLPLTGFHSMLPVFGSHLGVQLTIYNHLSDLKTLTIFTTLAEGTSLIGETDKFEISPVPVIENQQLTLLFGDVSIQEEVQYTLTAIMSSGGVRVASLTEQYTFANIPHSSNIDLNFMGIIIILNITIIIVIIMRIRRAPKS